MGKTRAPTAADSTAARAAAVNSNHKTAITIISGVTAIAGRFGGERAAAAAAAASSFATCGSCHLRDPVPEPDYTVPQRIPVPEVSTEDEELDEVKKWIRSQRKKKK